MGSPASSPRRRTRNDDRKRRRTATAWSSGSRAVSRHDPDARIGAGAAARDGARPSGDAGESTPSGTCGADGSASTGRHRNSGQRETALLPDPGSLHTVAPSPAWRRGKAGGGMGMTGPSPNLQSSTSLWISDDPGSVSKHRSRNNGGPTSSRAPHLHRPSTTYGPPNGRCCASGPLRAMGAGGDAAVDGGAGGRGSSTVVGVPFTMWYGWRAVMSTRSPAVCDIYSMAGGKPPERLAGMAANPAEAAWG